MALGLAGGLAGLGLAVLGVELVSKLGADTLPRLHERGVDVNVLLFTLGVSIVAGLLLGLPPAFRALPRQTAIDLVEAGTRTTGGRTHHRTLRILVGAQVALATVLLVGSGLASRSFQQLSQVDPGFSPQGLLTFRLSLPERDYPGAREVADFQRRAGRAPPRAAGRRRRRRRLLASVVGIRQRLRPRARGLSTRARGSAAGVHDAARHPRVLRNAGHRAVGGPRLHQRRAAPRPGRSSS